MTKRTNISLGILATVIVVVVGYVLYAGQIANPRVVVELRENPRGATAKRVMLLTFADGKSIPVNFLREGDRVYVGADGPWWRQLRNNRQRVSLLIQGQELMGRARVVDNDPALTRDVFSRLRPTAPTWLPDWLNGVLVIIELDARA